MLKSCKRACLVCNDGTSQFGVEQRVPTEEEAGAGGKERTISQIELSVQYMRRVWKDSDFANVQHKCKNQVCLKSTFSIVIVAKIINRNHPA